MDAPETLCHNDGQPTPRRGAILGVALATMLLLYLPLVLVLPERTGGWRIAIVLVVYALMASIPFVLARLIPRAAGFEARWFPLPWWHWLWFVGLVVLLLACRVLAAAIMASLCLRPHPSLEIDVPTVAGVVCAGITMILIGPIAEEIFWRGYFLEQLRKVAPSAIALFIQSVLFGLAHVQQHLALYASIQAFLVGAVLGVWRIRFRSLLPLMLAHMIFNGVVTLPALMESYQVAKFAKPFADDLAEHVEAVRSNPKCAHIRALAVEPAHEAVPKIIAYFADADEDVRLYAQEVLIHWFRREAEPYLKAPLSSRDKNILQTALFVVGFCRYSAYKKQVRQIAWSADDWATQYAAVVTLWDLKDEEGLRTIARNHAAAKVRESAERMLAYLSGRVPHNGRPPAEAPVPPAKSAPDSR